ncbi:MAG TPA: hypothetical protein VK610_09225 [Rhodothermales bacterium]|nr:hypothetical protein [Rhodothermales bacterium]
MTEDPDIVKVSSSLADVLARLHKAGGLSLVFLFIGVILVLIANMGGKFQAITMALGVILLLCSFAIFAFLHVKGPVRAIRTLRENKETIDSLQELGLELTGVANSAQLFAIRYIEQISDVIAKSLPVLMIIPGVGSKVKELGLDRVPQLTRLVVESSDNAERVIQDTERALRTADFSVLRQYAESLRGAKRGLRGAIAGISEAVASTESGNTTAP